VCFPPGSPAGSYQAEIAAASGLDAVKLHPSQLYDSALGFLTVILLLSLQGRLVKQGATFGLMLACYGTSRFVVDFSRFYEANMRVMGVFNLNQLVSIMLIASGAYLLLRKDRGREGSAAGPKK
jgi:prolipoprotein diacylglyceryltransferase